MALRICPECFGFTPPCKKCLARDFMPGQDKQTYAQLRAQERCIESLMQALRAPTSRAQTLRRQLALLILETLEMDLVEMALGVVEGAANKAPTRRRKG